MSDRHEVLVDGKRYVLAEEMPRDEETMKLLASMYGLIWIEACYDPYNKETEKFALTLMPSIVRLNEILKFKK